MSKVLLLLVGLGLIGAGAPVLAAMDYSSPLSVVDDTVVLWQFDSIATSAGGVSPRIVDAASNSDNWLMLYTYPDHPGTLVASENAALGQALEFDGVDDYGQTRRPIWKNYPTVKVEGWLKPYTLSGLQFVANSYSWRVYFNGSSLFLTVFFEDGTNESVAVDLGTDVNQWEHFTAYFDADGNVVLQTLNHGDATKAQPGKQLRAAGSDQNIFVGSEGAGVRRFYQGALDDLRVSQGPQPLTDDAQTLGLWHMETAAGDITPDDDSVNPGRDNDLELIDYGADGGPSVVAGADGLANALDFDGSDFALTLPGLVWANYNTVKIQAWINAHDTSGLRWIVNTGVFRLYIQNGNMAFKVLGETSGFQGPGLAIDSNSWNYVEASYGSDGVVRLSCGNTQSTYTLGENLAAHQGGIGIGAYAPAVAGSERFFDGAIAEMKISTEDTLVSATFEEDYTSPYTDEQGVFALWHMDADNSGVTPDDDSAQPGRDHDLTVNGAALEAQVNAAGFNNSFFFDGFDDALNAPTVVQDLSITPDNFRVQAWIKQTQDAVDFGVQGIVGFQGQLWRMVTKPDVGQIDWIMWDAQGSTVTISATGLDLTEWNHVAGQYYDGMATLFVNGRLAAVSQPFSVTQNNLTGLAIGKRASQAFWGWIDEVKISQVAYEPPPCGAWGYLDADVNQDCVVDGDDFTMLIEDWLGCTDPMDGACQDLN